MNSSVNRPNRIIILGSTGSIGTQTLEVIEHLNRIEPGSFEVVGLGAGRNAAMLADQARAFDVRDLALAHPPDSAIDDHRVRTGPDAAAQLVTDVECDMVVAGIVGYAGLTATLEAVRHGRHVLLANKETLVAAGELVIAESKRAGAALRPVDSEHSGVWQCLLAHGIPTANAEPPFDTARGVTRVTLTASGGPLRDVPTDQLDTVTPEQALDHPTWDMGAKVTIDTASLTNKALELIEAHWLFGLEPDRLDAVIHPTSTIHALVELADGSVIAQLGQPDMRTPIQCALTHPRRLPGLAPPLGPADLAGLGTLAFRAIDHDRHPALAAAHTVMRRGGTAGAVFNAANEAAVDAFLAKRIGFMELQRLGPASIDAVGASAIRDLDDVHAADAEGRRFVATHLDAVPAK
ncbi:MAG: 1-deoxy-D-xylulose-5-phosphate reductoisomerase [Planctomycetota bacterium]